MAVTAAKIKELRELTGAGMVDCKNALTETDGDIEKAVEVLREKGLSAVLKKAGRIASEGLAFASISEDNKIGVVVEVNSETDFVAKNQDFKTYVAKVAAQAMTSDATDMDAFLAETWADDTSVTVKDALSQKIAIIGENLSIRRFEKFVKEKPGQIISYIHGGGRVAVLIELSCEKQSDLIVEAGKNISMQIAAMSPKFLKREDVSQDFIEKERKILTEQALNEGKPANIVEKMIEGRLNKELKEFCLLDQEYVKDDKMTVKQYVESISKEVGATVVVERFVRFETGEGLEKKEENFAEEVSKAMQG